MRTKRRGMDINLHTLLYEEDSFGIFLLVGLTGLGAYFLISA